MIRYSASLAAVLAAMTWSDVADARTLAAPEKPRPMAETGLRLAQAREVEIVVDERGRELIVDVYTGEVLAVRPRRSGPAARRAAREYELGRPAREPLGERLDRELEIMLGRREAPRVLEPDYDPEPGYEPDYEAREPSYGLPRESFPPPPEDYRLTRPAPDYERGVIGGNRYEDRVGPAPRGVDRAPLGAPDTTMPGQDGGTVAAVPDGGGQVIEPVPTLPDGRIAPPVTAGASAEVANIQILLDRAGLSPGVIDGRMGDNVNKALSAYREKLGNALRTYDRESIEAALAESGGPAFVDYTIEPVDVAGPFVASVPEDYGEKATLDRLGFTSVTEMLAERFHMDENYLKALNPGVDFNRPGTIVKVANVGQPLTDKVARIVADKARKQVRAYDASGRMVAAYPATIGSGDTPSPSGTVTVERIAFDPEYTYNPNINFKQGDNHKVLTIPPGPNGPVGSIWIALSKPTYGIHGTPEPSKIGKTYSHGCVRLTNWDAAELAKMVSKGVTVEFAE